VRNRDDYALSDIWWAQKRGNWVVIRLKKPPDFIYFYVRDSEPSIKDLVDILPTFDDAHVTEIGTLDKLILQVFCPDKKVKVIKKKA